MNISIKLTPCASKNELIKISDTDWKVRLTASPVEGKANHALIKFLAKELGLKKAQIEIIKGLKSKNKIVKISM